MSPPAALADKATLRYWLDVLGTIEAVAEATGVRLATVRRWQRLGLPVAELYWPFLDAAADGRPRPATGAATGLGTLAGTNKASMLYWRTMLGSLDAVAGAAKVVLSTAKRWHRLDDVPERYWPMLDAAVAARQSPSSTADRFAEAWRKTAEGEALAYYKGNLAADCSGGPNQALALAARCWARTRPDATLAQRRSPDGNGYEYLAVKRRLTTMISEDNRRAA